MVRWCLLRTQQCAELFFCGLLGRGDGLFVPVCVVFVGQVSMESLILAQDERWRRA
jgi:hypothetical protein